MSLLTCIQEFARRSGKGIAVPTSVIGSADPQILQLWGLANELAIDLVDRFDWEELEEEATFTSVATEDQGVMTTLAPSGFYSVKNDTIYDRTRHIPIYGPLSAEVWQQNKALPNSGPVSRYRIRKGHLYLNPAPAAGHTIAFEYKSKWIVAAADGVTFKESFTADDDTLLISEQLLTLGLRWKWRAENGLDYAEEFSAYENKVNSLTLRGGHVGAVDTSNTKGTWPSAIVIPLGNWTP